MMFLNCCAPWLPKDEPVHWGSPGQLIPLFPGANRRVPEGWSEIECQEDWPILLIDDWWDAGAV